MSNLQNGIPFIADFPAYFDSIYGQFSGTVAAGTTPTLIATQTVPAITPKLWVLRLVVCRLRVVGTAGDLFVTFVVARNGVNNQIRFEAPLFDTQNNNIPLHIILRPNDSITVTASNTSITSYNVFCSYIADEYNL